MNKLFFWVCAVLMTACTSYKNDEVLTESGLSKSRFQTEINGEKTDLFVLKNKFVSLTMAVVLFLLWFLIKME